MAEMDEQYQGIQAMIRQAIRGARARERASIVSWIEKYLECNPITFVDGGDVRHYRACDCTKCHPKDHGLMLNELLDYINNREQQHDENSSD